jgi:hypothetical protein
MGIRAKHPVWNRAFLALELACIPLVIWWLPYSHLPHPGWAVAFMAGVTAAMSVHDDMKGWQKGIWLLIIGALLVTELRAINKDRAESNTQAIADRADQDKHFGDIQDTQNKTFATTAQDLKDAYSLSQKQFAATMGKSESLLHETKTINALTEENLKNITGGDSSAYFELVYLNDVIPQLWIENKGKYPLRNLSVQVEDVNILENRSDSMGPSRITLEDINNANSNIKMGDIGSHQLAQISVNPVAHGIELAHYLITYTALNGGGDEVIIVRAGKDGKKYTAIQTGGTNQPLKQEISPGFPLSEKEKSTGKPFGFY